MKERQRILKIRNLNISFKTDSGKVSAIRGVNLDLYKGETIAIVGESGSGKSVTTKAIMGILSKNGTIDSGSIEYTWEDEQTKELHRFITIKRSTNAKRNSWKKDCNGIPGSYDFPKSYHDHWKTNHGTYDVSLWKNKTRSLCTGSGIAGTCRYHRCKKTYEKLSASIIRWYATKNCYCDCLIL